MRSVFRFAPVGFLSLSTLTLSSGALADGPKASSTKTTSVEVPNAAAGEKADQDPGSTHLSGLELVLRPSFGGAPATSPVRYAPNAQAGLSGADPGAVAGGASPFGGGFVGQAMVGARFHALVSAGLRAGYRSASASVQSDGTTDLTRSAWDAGLYLRAYPLAMSPAIRKHIDPWVGTGVGYMRDVQSYKRPLGNVSVDWTLDHHAVAVPLGVGVDYRVLPMLSVGPSFEYTLANTVAGCLKASTSTPGFVGSSYCSNEDPGKQFVKADSYGVWSAGLDVRATF